MAQGVLVIDDSRTMQGLIRSQLAGEDVDLHFANSGESGLRLAAALQPDTILLDVEMPGLDGFEVCRRLKVDPATMIIPVIFLSGTSSTQRKIEGLNLGAADYVAKPVDPAELRARVRGTLRIKYLLDLLRQRALIDGLTGLWNRVYLEQRLTAALAAAARHGSPLSCVLVDVDHFKSVNDRYGHLFGDEALRTAAQALLTGCRAEDVVCRYGGEEFAVLTPGVSLEGAAALAERLRCAIKSKAILYEREPVHLTCSFGVAEAEEPLIDSTAVLAAADAALYRAKARGRDRVERATDRAVNMEVNAECSTAGNS